MDIKHEGNAGITQFLDPIHRFQASRHPNLVDVLPATPDGPWSRFVAPGATTARYPRLVPLDADHAPKLRKRTLTNLYNERPAWLAHAHGDLDAAVLAAYGWPADLPDSEILSRLLDLNLST